LKKHAENAVTGEMMKNAKSRFPTQTPSSKEEYYYREIFDNYFTNPTAALTVPVGPQLPVQRQLRSGGVKNSPIWLTPRVDL